MKAELSGNIYRFHLGAGLGLDAYCQLLDFSDISTFDGKKITVFKLLDNTDSQNTNIEEIKASGVLFGPVPIMKYPNTKGKGAWKFIGKDEDYDKEIPVVKNVQRVLTANNWASVGKWWYKLYGFKERSEYLDYEDVRSLEIQYL